MDFLSTKRKRIILFTWLYASEGAPIGFLWWALPTELRSFDVPIEHITGLTAALAIPWAMKFLWAPAIDWLRTSRWTYRSWIIVSQTTMGVLLLPLLVIDISEHFTILSIFLLLHAFAAATQDVAIDALCISEVQDNERGILNGWMQAGMLTARAAFGGVAIIVMQTIGVTYVVIMMIATIWGSLFLVAFSKEKIPYKEIGVSLSIGSLKRSLSEMMRSQVLWYGMMFALVGGIGFESVGAVVGPFLIDLSMEKGTIGIFFSLFSPLGMMSGALFGGYLLRSYPIQKLLAHVIAYIAVVILVIAGISSGQMPSSENFLIGSLTILYFGIGLFTTASYTMFMNATDPRLGATQFSAYMGGTNLCESISAFSIGLLIAQYEYSAAFFIIAIISLSGIIVLRGFHTAVLQKQASLLP